VTITVAEDGTASYSSTLDVTGISTSELSPVAVFSAIHLHNAPAGSNGGVVQDVIQDAGGDENGLALSPEADTGDGNVFNEVIEVDTLISIETVIGQNGAPITTASAASQAQSTALTSAEVEVAPIFEAVNAFRSDEYDDEYTNMQTFEDETDVFVPDMFGVA